MTELQPILDLLAGKAGWLPTALAWIAALRTAAVFFGAAFKRWASDKLNAVASTADVDDDTYLRELLARPGYKFVAFVLLLGGLELPSTADLERAIRLQNEARAGK